MAGDAAALSSLPPATFNFVRWESQKREERKGHHFPKSRKSWILENADDTFDINIGSEQRFQQIFEELVCQHLAGKGVPQSQADPVPLSVVLPDWVSKAVVEILLKPAG